MTHGGENNYIVLATSKDKADEISKKLANFKVVGSSGNPKYVSQHLKANSKYGVVLTDKDASRLNYLHGFYMRMRH